MDGQIPGLAVSQAPPSSPSRRSTTWLGWVLGLSRSASTSVLSSLRWRRPQPASTAPPPPPPLMEELEEEILLRFPPDDPALLVRATLVCKRWQRIVSSPSFLRRFRELHRTPPMLGFLCNIAEGDSSAAFVTTVAEDFCSSVADLGDCHALDARHGRVLLRCPGSSKDCLLVWDPISDEHRELSLPVLQRYTYDWNAAVLCAARGPCDHLDCCGGPFLVVFVGSVSGEAFICTYSSDAGTWSELIATELGTDCVSLMPSVLVGNALYFGFLFRKSLLKYDLESDEMSVIGVPHTLYIWKHVALDSGLGLATVHESKLCLWRQAGPEVDARWTQDRVIELEPLLPDDAFLTSPDVVGCADGIGVIFIRAGRVLFTIDLKTYEVKKVCKGRNIFYVVPYMTFYTPALRAAVQMKDHVCVPLVHEKLRVRAS
ncbi:hypothetical protein BS78_03G300800 [Paspalum vaginatum]|nr:hypothetical protein BS78_03G300800 [Paspalum vaginatum]